MRPALVLGGLPEPARDPFDEKYPAWALARAQFDSWSANTPALAFRRAGHHAPPEPPHALDEADRP